MFSLAVRNVLMSQLVPYLDEYMGYVIKAFEKLNIDNEFVTKIHWYFEKRSDAIDKRRSLKEMSPKYGYMIEYQEALKTQKQHWQQQMKKADENHKSLLSSMMKHVTLARGGGWRDENGKVQHLGCIQFSMPSRQLAQSMTPMEQDKWINDLFKSKNIKKPSSDLIHGLVEKVIVYATHEFEIIFKFDVEKLMGGALNE